MSAFAPTLKPSVRQFYFEKLADLKPYADHPPIHDCPALRLVIDHPPKDVEWDSSKRLREVEDLISLAFDMDLIRVVAIERLDVD